MADIFDDMTMDSDKAQKVKSNEISGDRFQFHSLPKEFQDWHNVYYMLEKDGQGALDKNAVSKAILNGYMWKTIGDGSAYGIAAAITSISAAIKWKMTYGILGFVFAFIFFLPIMIFISYHFIFYAIIRAQVVGPVTKQAANATTYTFYATFFGVYLSLMAAFVFLIAIAKDLLVLLFMIIHDMSKKNPTGYMADVENGMIWLHNKVVDLFITSGPLFDNIYFLTFIIVIFSIVLFYWFELKHYNPNKIDITNEMLKTKNKQAYPIETAQRIMSEWRKRNGM